MSVIDQTILAAHLASTAAMAGLVTFVQVVHYPLMSRVRPEDFVAFEASHTSRTSLVVAPLMLIEAASSLWVLSRDPRDWAAIAGAVLLAYVWIWTFGVMVPLHGRLSKGWDARAHTRLVRLNGPRTIAWWLRTVLAAWMIFKGAAT
jgi:hypothetical protein